MIKSRSIIAALAAGTFVLAACSASSTDFVKAAEKAITDKVPDSKAKCEKPPKTDVGTTFSCTATFSDGTTQELVATITKKDFVEVAPAGAATPDSTATGETVADTTADTAGG